MALGQVAAKVRALDRIPLAAKRRQDFRPGEVAHLSMTASRQLQLSAEGTGSTLMAGPMLPMDTASGARNR